MKISELKKIINEEFKSITENTSKSVYNSNVNIEMNTDALLKYGILKALNKNNNYNVSFDDKSLLPSISWHMDVSGYKYFSAIPVVPNQNITIYYNTETENDYILDSKTISISNVECKLYIEQLNNIEKYIYIDINTLSFEGNKIIATFNLFGR